MLDSLKSLINSVLMWMVGGVADIAMGLGSIATHARDIPVVGTVLANLFTIIQSAFNGLGYDMIQFSNYLSDILDVVAVWLDQMAALAYDVNQWILQGISEISFDLSALKNAVINWIGDVLEEIRDVLRYNLLDLLPWFVEVLGEGGESLVNLVNFVSDWVIEKLIWTYDAARWVIDQVGFLADNIADLPGIIKSEILQLIAPVFNLVEFFFQDISDFFSDPADYLDKKVDKLGPSFAERLWGVVEKILEKVW